MGSHTPKLGYSNGPPKRHAVLISRRTIIGCALLLLLVYSLTSRRAATSQQQARQVVKLAGSGGDIPFIIDSENPPKLNNKPVAPARAPGRVNVRPPSHAYEEDDDEEVVIGKVNAGGSGRRPKEFGRPAGDGPVAPAPVRKPAAAPLRAMDDFQIDAHKAKEPLPMANINGERKPIAEPLPGKKPPTEPSEDQHRVGAYEALVKGKGPQRVAQEGDDGDATGEGDASGGRADTPAEDSDWPIPKKVGRPLIHLEDDEEQGQVEQINKIEKEQAAAANEDDEVKEQPAQAKTGAALTIDDDEDKTPTPTFNDVEKDDRFELSRPAPGRVKDNAAALAKAKQDAKADKGSQYAAGTAEEDEVSEDYAKEDEPAVDSLDEEEDSPAGLSEDLDEFFGVKDKAKADSTKPKFGTNGDTRENELLDVPDSAALHALDEGTQRKGTRPQAGPYGAAAQPPRNDEDDEDDDAAGRHRADSRFAEVDSLTAKVRPAAEITNKFVKAAKGKTALELLQQAAVEEEREALSEDEDGTSDGEGGEWANERK